MDAAEAGRLTEVKHEQTKSHSEYLQSTKIAAISSAVFAEFSSEANSRKHLSLCLYDYLVCLDFEATCEEPVYDVTSRSTTALENADVIEFAWSAVSVDELRVTATERILCKPEHLPISRHCSSLTGITSEELEVAGTLKDAIAKFDKFLDEHIRNHNKTFCIVSSGMWQLVYQLPREAQRKELIPPDYMSRFFDVKKEFSIWLSRNQPKIPPRGQTLQDICAALDVAFYGKLHCAIETVRTMSEIVIALLSKPGEAKVFLRPFDLHGDYMKFKEDKEKILYLTDAPFRADRKEINDWIEMYGQTRPARLLTCAGPDGRPSGYGFLIFDLHEQAASALTTLYGTPIDGRIILLTPSSGAAIEETKAFTSDFPVGNLMGGGPQRRSQKQNGG